MLHVMLLMVVVMISKFVDSYDSQIYQISEYHRISPLITADLSSKSSKHQYPSVFPSNLARWSGLQSFIFSSRRGTSLGQHVLMASQVLSDPGPKAS